MNALRLLMTHHDRIEGLLVDLSQATEAAREPIFRDFSRILERHLDVEENLFYPAVSSRLILVKAAPFIEEHQDIRDTLGRVGAGLGGADFARLLEELHDVVVRHISEEEIELLAEVKRRFEVDELDALGERIEAAMQASGQPIEPPERRFEEPEEAEEPAEPPE